MLLWLQSQKVGRRKLPYPYSLSLAAKIADEKDSNATKFGAV